jgi:hypothetical protein
MIIRKNNRGYPMKYTIRKCLALLLGSFCIAVVSPAADCRAEELIFPEVPLRITCTPTPTPIPFPSGYSSSDYPESLLEFMEKYPEASDYVLSYPKKKDLHRTVDLTSEVTKGEIPLFIQWDERWGYEEYGDGLLGVTGCGPTCLSMVKCGLTGDTQWTPFAVAQMADKGGYYVNGVGSSWDLMTEGAKTLGLTVHEMSFSEESIRSTLEDGLPIICSVGPGDFTYTGHFIVLSGVNEDGTIQVRDPNSPTNSEKSWDAQVLIGQIKNLWSYSAE